MKTDENGRLLRQAIWLTVLLHQAVAIWHGSAHSAIPVVLSTAQTAFVAIVIIVLPLVGSFLLWTRFRQLGAWTVALSMLGSLLFGVINHFILASPDNIAQVPEHVSRQAFLWSAFLLPVTEALGTVLGAIAGAGYYLSNGRKT